MSPELQNFVLHALFFLGSYGFSMVLYSILLRFARTLGIREQHDIVRWASTAKPALGGITFFIVFLLSLVFQSIAFPEEELLSSSASLGLLGVAMMAFMMGLADDAYNTRPLLKFLVQVSCGVLLVVTGSSIQIFGNPLYDGILTVVWVVGIMNSINMLDNMDGISTITSMFIFVTGLVYMALHDGFSEADFMILLGAVASLFAFLFYNWHPSRMYMGDTGSQFLGIILAVIGIRYFWNSTLYNGDQAFSQQLLALLIGFLLPIVDTTIVSINRISRGQSPFVGGRDHTTHSLSYMGLSDSQVALIFSGISMFNLVLCYIIFRFVEEWSHGFTIALSAYVLAVFLILFSIAKRQKHNYIEQQ